MGMYLLLFVGAVLFAVVTVAAVLRGRVAAAHGVAGSGPLGRLVAVQTELHRQLGRLGAYVVTTLAGLAAVVVICWPLGRLAKRLQPLDNRLYPIAVHHQTHTLTSSMKILTQMGNRSQIKDILVVAAVLLAVAYWRRWWVPLLVLVTAFPAEKFLQSLLGKVVHRGHPPIGLGTYPSGGVARLVVIYGIIWLLLLLRFTAIDKRIALAGWALLGIGAWVEGFSRFYLLKHWTTDVVGGWIFGTLLLLVLAVLATGLAHAPPKRGHPERAHRSPTTGRDEPEPHREPVTTASAPPIGNRLRSGPASVISRNRLRPGPESAISGNRLRPGRR